MGHSLETKINAATVDILEYLAEGKSIGEVMSILVKAETIPQHLIDSTISAAIKEACDGYLGHMNTCEQIDPRDEALY